MCKKIVLLTFVSVLLLSVMVMEGAASPETTVYVYPEESIVKVCETFTVDVNILDVTGLQGFDFMLAYDTTVLDCLEVVEGPFMASFGTTFVAKLEVEDEYTATRGRVWVAIVLLGDAFADGNGTLATITFKATAPGESLLDLYSDYPFTPDEVKLVTCCPEPIHHVAVDGYVVVSPDPDDPPDPPNPSDTPYTDLNGDRIVDMRDIGIACRAFGAFPGHSWWVPNADINDDGTIDMRDIGTVCRHFGETI